MTATPAGSAGPAEAVAGQNVAAAVLLTGVWHDYVPGKPALRDIQLEVRTGERVGLIGPSGAGKSTLLRIVNGLVSATGGEVRTLGEAVGELGETGRMRLRRRVGMVFQDFALVERLPVLTNVLIGRLGYTATVASLLGRFARADVESSRGALAEVGLAGLDERPVRSLSGGQKQRVAIARALVQQAPLILADEPTANLDVRTADEVLGLLVRLAQERAATLLLSLHDVRAARRYCTRIVALRDGRIAWDGPPGAFDDAALESIFY
ncbi:MAG: phosphonate ABC transporter ATP-binding protein [Chthonomonadales bacterium]|nr:phosphonate ABC transporter ATP-binding protein [Chthonomonadales bacterium]